MLIWAGRPAAGVYWPGLRRLAQPKSFETTDMAHAARFLFPDPPREPRHVKKLFVDREREQQQALTQIDAVRKDDALRRPMAIVGPARVGKSHLLQQVAGQLGRKFDVLVPIRVSTGLRDIRDILRETLRQLNVALHNAVLRKGLGPVAGDGVLAPLDSILNDYSEAVAGSATEIEIGRVEKVTHAFKKSPEMSVAAPGLIKFLSGTEKTRTETESEERKVRVNRFEENHLTELSGMAHTLVREHAPKWRTMLILDDFDLLKRDEEGNFDPDALLQSLAILADIPGFYVMTTVRQDTFRRHGKTFHRIANVLPFVDEAPLIEIYERHVKMYNDGIEPCSETFVRDAARLSNGRVGIFLQHLREAYETEGPDFHHLELRPWTLGRWQLISREEPELAAVIIRATNENSGLLGADDLARLRASELIGWVLEDYTSETAARVDPILAGALRE